MKPDGDILRRADYVVEPVPWAMAREMFRAYHYTGGSGNAVVFRHGLFHRNNAMDCLGAAFWMAAVPPVARSVGANPSEVVTLSRLVVQPGMPTNAASFLLGGSVRLIRADGRFRVLVTYADEGQGHTGTIYRATNWGYLGATKGASGGSWVNADGKRVDRRLGPWFRSVEEMTALGYVRLPESRKHKFVIKLT